MQEFIRSILKRLIGKKQGVIKLKPRRDNTGELARVTVRNR